MRFRVCSMQLLRKRRIQAISFKINPAKINLENTSTRQVMKIRCDFRTLLNIYDGVFLQKIPTIDVSLGPKYASEHFPKICTFLLLIKFTSKTTTGTYFNGIIQEFSYLKDKNQRRSHVFYETIPINAKLS